MKKIFYFLVLFVMASACQENNNTSRETDFNKQWKFSLNIINGAHKTDYNDESWRTLDLPHDWSIELPFDSVKGEGCTAYLLGGVGWYRKHFKLDVDAGKKVFVVFDGVYNNSEIWLNGNKLGEHPYGYSPFYYDLSSFLNASGEENILAVKVDHSRYADSRWYTGSGIYRNVKLVVTGKVYIPVWGTFITTTEVSEERSVVDINIEIKNELDNNKNIDVITDIYNQNNDLVQSVKTENIQAKELTTISQKLTIESPVLWEIENPYLYSAKTILKENGKEIDSYTTRFGIRSLKFDADNGFFLNGKNMKIKGVCLHHDGGLVGAAVPKEVWKRRLHTLKEAGCNAIRIAHNPASNEFLDLCDEMGFLVQDEFFDEWDYPKDKRLNMWEQHDDYITRGYTEHFQQSAENDLKSVMKSHRNHPSIFQWSIGNEIEWTYPGNREATGFFNNMDWSGNYFWSQPPNAPEKIKEIYKTFPHGEYTIGATAKKLADWTREMDTTRPVIANCILPSASFETGYADALDIAGFSYRRVMYDYAKKYYPNKVVMGTENLGQWHEWKAVMERPFVSGLFLWTGIDYLGEANNRWPKKGLSCGLIDMAGFTKPSYHMYKSLWIEEPSIYLCSNTADNSKYMLNDSGKVVEKKAGAWENALWEWYDVNEHWNYTDKENIIVEVISNCEEVELFLNNKSLGTKKLAEFPDRIYKWAVPFSKGKIEAVGITLGGTVKYDIETSGNAKSIQISSDISTLQKDGIAHIVAQLIDQNGIPVLNQDTEIEFDIQGDLKILGVDNGATDNLQPYQSNKIKTHNGRALLIVRAKEKSGKTTVTVKGNDLENGSLQLSVK